VEKFKGGWTCVDDDDDDDAHPVFSSTVSCVEVKDQMCNFIWNNRRIVYDENDSEMSVSHEIK